jgi:putative tricarboxylic transport membrane protein
MMTTFARRADFWSGLALAALGTYIVSEARKWVYLGEDGPGAGFFPMWYGSAMVVLSLLLVAGTVLKGPKAEAHAEVRWGELGRAMTCWLAFVACIALMPVLGFPIAFALLTWFIVAVMARQPQRIALSVSIGGALLFYVLFELALELSLPKGMLF